ncbi:MAG TPA: class I SAM-dependent methyltransferase [Bacteroidota bacterium]|nr:class I SAM-dependent methyltransferase [Bacteroidota bacterium]
MFHTIRPSMKARMEYLEAIDRRDRTDGTPRMRRLRQITPETGQFLAILAAGAPEGAYLEIGTSAGYSALWISLACETLGRTVTTFEILQEKAELARETFRLAEVGKTVALVEGDALKHISRYRGVSFCFLDTEKELYTPLYEEIVSKLVSGGLLVADNAIDHREELAPFLERALADERLDSLIVPIGKGELLCRKI